MPRRRKDWTPERRAGASLEASLRWEQTPPEVREEWRAKGRATFAAKYPHRLEIAAAIRARIASGELVPGPCDRCGGEGHPLMRWDDEAGSGELVGWRCYPCRKAAPTTV